MMKMKETLIVTALVLVTMVLLSAMIVGVTLAVVTLIPHGYYVMVAVLVLGTFGLVWAHTRS